MAVLCDQELNKRMKQRFASFSGIVEITSSARPWATPLTKESL